MKKISFLFALLCASVMSFAVDQDTWIGSTDPAYNEQFKWTEVANVAKPNEVVNIQKPGFASEIGIYITFPDAAFNAVYLNDVLATSGTEYSQQGAGLVFHVSAFTMKNTTVILKNDATIKYGFTIYNEKGTESGSGDAKTASELSINATEKTLDATNSETFQIEATTAQGYDGTVTYASSKDGIATVSASGLVTAAGRGTATITVTAPETENFAASTKKLTVTVTGPINWDGVDWLAGSDNKYKVMVDPIIPSQFGGMSKQGDDLYIGFPSSAFGEMSIEPSAGEGAWKKFALSNFPAKENQFTVVCDNKTYTFDVYYEDGKDVVEIYDTNFALASNGSSATASSGNAAAAIDGNTGTRWESATTKPNPDQEAEEKTIPMTDEEKNNQWWMVDMGQLRIYNTIQIIWEGAYGKTFDIESSKDGENWKVVKQVADQALSGFPYVQTLELAANDTAQYIRYKGIARGTGYGYSFWEFRVLLPGVSTLTTIELSAAGKIAKVDGAGVALTVTPKDQNGKAMEAEISYEITPAAAGNVVDGKYVAAQTGAASIVAYNGEVRSNAVTIYGVASDNLALSTNIMTDNKIVAQSAFGPDGTSAFYAVDGNQGSVYQGRASNSAGVDFDAWFVVDLGAYYNIDMVTINFEGACAQNYHVDFSGDNTEWLLGYDFVGTSGINGRTDYISTLTNNQKVRYVRFWSTKAATEWGMKIFEFQVFGQEWVDSGDTEAPVMVSATLVSKNHNTAVIAVEATDNHEIASYRVVGTDLDKKIAAVDGKITVTGLTPNTAYTLTVTAFDVAGNESANNKSVEFTTNNYITAPTAAAEAPTWDASWVKAIYSPTYNANCGFGEWGSGTTVTDTEFGKKYVTVGGGYFGMVDFAINALTMEKLHFDIWIADDATISVVPIWGGAEQGVTVTLKGQQWNSVDIALEQYTGITDWSNIYQMKIDQASNLTFWVGNAYFYRESELVDDEKPTNVTAATSLESYFSVKLTVSADDNSGAVLYVVKDGETEVGSGAGASGANVNITINNLTPNTEYNFNVIAKDEKGNEADPVAVSAKTLVVPGAAPAPSAVASNVKSLYSNTYENATNVTNYCENWWLAPNLTQCVLGEDNNTLLYENIQSTSSFGIGFAKMNIEGFQKVHISIYPINASTLIVLPIVDGVNGKTSTTLVANEWNEVVFDYTDATISADITQLGFRGIGALGAFFLDNVYFFKEEGGSAVENTENGNVQSAKVIENGVLYIVRDGIRYNIMGAKVK